MKKWLIGALLLLMMTTTVQAADAPVAKVYSGGKAVEEYTTVQAAVDAAAQMENAHVQLLQDVEESVTVTGTLYLDLNGYDLKGIVIQGTLYCVDTATNSLDASKAGSLTPARGKPQEYAHTQKTHMGYSMQYLTVKTGESYSFHRFTMQISKLTVNIENRGLGYKATFRSSPYVQSLLLQTEACGYNLWVDGCAPVTRSFGVEKLSTGEEIPLMLNNFLDDSQSVLENTLRGQVQVHANVFIKLKDGTVITADKVSYSFQEMLEAVDARFAQYDAQQQAAVKQLNEDFRMAFFGWDLPHLHHLQGDWEMVNAAGFAAKLTKSGSYYNITPGSYVLTEDVKLGDKQLRIAEGTEVTICLNGHDINANLRIFRNYGKLNLCDCSVHDGTVYSSYALTGSSSVYAPILYGYYNSEFNLYDGVLKAGGEMSAAGVIALSHDGKDANATLPSSVMNMYGGEIVGGVSRGPGGLISEWNGSVFTMYDGILRDGTAAASGGCIQVSDSYCYIYGGEISGGTSTGSGGNIFCDDGAVYIGNARIFGGSAGASGGNVYCKDGTLQISGGEITNGVAAVCGGNVYGNIVDISITDTQITGGAAEKGGGVYLYDIQLTLGGEMTVTDNKNGGLWVDIYSPMDTQDLTGGRIGMVVEAMRTLSENGSMTDVFFSDTEQYTVKKLYGKTVMVASDVRECAAPAGFSAGFGQSNITPETIEGMPLAGYGNAETRLATAQTLEIYDELLAQTVAVTDATGETVLLIACDLIRPSEKFTRSVVEAVSAATGVEKGNIVLSCSHSHSNPEINQTGNDLVKAYNKTLPDLFARSAVQAMADRKPATMESGSFEVQATINGKTYDMNFVRHYKHTDADGVVKYFGDNFGVNVLDATTEHVWEADHTMHLVQFTRDGKDILMSNWRVHPHKTGGFEKYKISADIIGTTRYYMEQKTDMHFIYFNGAAGNINSYSRIVALTPNLDYVKYGEVLANCIIENLDCMDRRQAGNIQVDNYSMTAYYDHSDDDKYEAALAFKKQMDAETVGMSSTQRMAYCQKYGYDSPFEVNFLVSRYNRGYSNQLPLNVISIGNVLGLYTVPGELWDSAGLEVEEASPFVTTFCLGYSMDHNNYFVYYPESLDEHDGVPYKSYESENRRYVAPDTILNMLAYWKNALQKLYNQA